MFVEFEDGRTLEIHPLFSDIGIILFDIKRLKDINIDWTPCEDKKSILGIDIEGKVVWQYEASSNISTIQNTVLYPDGRVWMGPILTNVENRIEWAVLTERALHLLKDSSEFTFDDPTEDKRPTILVKLKTPVLPLCGSHTCNGQNCQRDGKFSDNSYERTLF
jgi:hypothetical protein